MLTNCLHFIFNMIKVITYICCMDSQAAIFFLLPSLASSNFEKRTSFFLNISLRKIFFRSKVMYIFKLHGLYCAPVNFIIIVSPSYSTYFGLHHRDSRSVSTYEILLQEGKHPKVLAVFGETQFSRTAI